MDLISGIVKVFSEAIKIGGPSVVITILWQFVLAIALISSAVIVKKVIDRMKKDSLESKLDSVYINIVKLSADYTVHTGRITNMVGEALKNYKGLLRPEHVHVILEILFAANRADFLEVVEAVISNIGDNSITDEIRAQNIDYMRGRFSSILTATDREMFTLPDIGTALADTDLKLKYLEDSGVYEFTMKTIAENRPNYKKIRDRVRERLADVMTTKWKLRH